MPLSTRIDHVAIAVPAIDPALARWRDQLGGSVQWRFHTPTVFRGAAVQFRNEGFLEMLMPSDATERTREAGGPSGFVDGFLERFGAQVHHVTLKVPDLDEALATLAEEGFEARDVNRSEPYWQELFLRPSQVGGLVVQIAFSDRTPEEWAGVNGHDTVPPPPTTGASLLGPQLTHPDLAEARRVWTALGATVTDDGDGLLVGWADEPLTIAIAPGERAEAVGLRFRDTPPLPADPALGPPVLVAPTEADRTVELRALLEGSVRRREPRSVLEVGVGERPLALDLEVDAHYTGVDADEERIAAARRAAPGHEFAVADLTALSVPELRTADLVVCADLLTRVEDPERFRLVVQRLVALSNDVVVAVGHDVPPAGGDAFHGPIATELLLAGLGDLVQIAAHDDGRVVYEGRVRR